MSVKVAMLSLGCARNLVDAEVLLGYLKGARIRVIDEIDAADVAIINTCCFIQDAQEESIEVILKACELKKRGRLRNIVVSGCMVQRYKDKLIPELKEVDAFIDVGSIDKIVEVIQKISKGKTPIKAFGNPEFLYDHTQERVYLTPEHFAYVKISEGCAHACSYCVIPSIRGKYRSRGMHSITKEVDVLLSRRNISEINLIGQDTTMYGYDLYDKNSIAKLISKIAKKAQGKWVRLLYAHPHNFPRDLISVINDHECLCKYIDLPIQHIDDTILKNMKRGVKPKQIYSLIELLRRKIPNLAIRSTLIVGFPGETQKQFRILCDFIRQVKFERLGLFKYSAQEGTPAYNLANQVSEEVKESRFQEALTLQKDISTQINEKFLKRTLKVLIDERDENDSQVFLGRTQYDAPEVDGCVYIKSTRALNPGTFVDAKIVDTLEYDLVGEIT